MTNGLSWRTISKRISWKGILQWSWSSTLLQKVLIGLQHIFDRGLYAAAHEVTLFSRSVTWWGEVYSSESKACVPEHIEGLVNPRRPATGVELMQFRTGCRRCYLCWKTPLARCMHYRRCC